MRAAVEAAVAGALEGTAAAVAAAVEVATARERARGQGALAKQEMTVGMVSFTRIEKIKHHGTSATLSISATISIAPNQPNMSHAEPPAPR